MKLKWVKDTGQRYRRWVPIIAVVVISSVAGYLLIDNLSSKISLIRESDHFLFYFDGAFASRIQPIVDALEGNYDRIVDDLRPESVPKVRVMIWSSKENFYKAMEELLGVRYAGADGYVYGAGEFHIRLVRDAAGNAVHEFSHVVSLNVNREFANNPRWLWEAVAIYEAQEFVDPKKVQYMVEGDYPTLSELNLGFGTGGNRIYSLGYILAEYVVEGWGMEALRGLIESNGNMISVLGVDIKEFENGWHEWLERKFFS